MAKFYAYPMPRVEEMFESMGTASIISTLDLSKGYWKIPMAPDSHEKTAFALYKFKVISFGHHNAPATFQRTMNHVLRGCQKFAQSYLYDIVVYSQHLQEVFELL